MKKIINIVLVAAMAFVAFSCKSVDADKDVKACIAKLNAFNDEFEELYDDEKIDTTGDDSEYDKLKKLANDYYDHMVSIQRKIDDEDDGAEYKKSYEASVKENQEELDEAAQKFLDNMNVIESITATVEESEEEVVAEDEKEDVSDADENDADNNEEKVEGENLNNDEVSDETIVEEKEVEEEPVAEEPAEVEEKE
jgi:hypothetical protein